MNRYDVNKGYFKFLKESSLPASEVILSAGAAMVVLGHRTHTGDLDIDVPEWFFLQHKQRHNFRKGPTGEFVQYNCKISMQVNRLQESDIQVTRTRLNGLIFTYNETLLFKQKVTLLEQPNRSATRTERDVADCEALLKAFSGRVLTPEEVSLINRYHAAVRELQWSLA